MANEPPKKIWVEAPYCTVQGEVPNIEFVDQWDQSKGCRAQAFSDKRPRAETYFHQSVIDAKDARIKELEGALKGMLGSICGEDGFVECVRRDTGMAYPWPSLELAEGKARAVLDKGE